MNIIFVCGCSKFTTDINLSSMLQDLEERGIHVKAIIFSRLISKKLFNLSLRRFGLQNCRKIFALLTRHKRHQKVSDSGQPVRSLSALEVAQKYGILVHNVSDFYKKSSLDFLRGLEPDLLVPIGMGIVRKQILQIPGVGTLNAHSGLLPKYRGMNVVEWALFDGHRLGVSIHFMDEGIDTGGILLQKEFDVATGDTIDTLRNRSSKLGKQAMVEAIAKICDGQLRPVPQQSGDGQQYFIMHPSLKLMIDGELSEVYGR
jgi:methionyl-tRNA formyltransferase